MATEYPLPGAFRPPERAHSVQALVPMYRMGWSFVP